MMHLIALSIMSQVQEFGDMKDISEINQELEEINAFMNNEENVGKIFTTGTHVVCYGTPTPLSTEEGIKILEEGFRSIRERLVDH